MKKNTIIDLLCAALSGLCNGMLGTGGGIPLWFAAVRKGDRRAAFATASFGVLMLSAVSLWTGGAFSAAVEALPPTTPYLALLGGACGALLLGRLPTGLLKWIFSLLLIGSGGYTLWQVFSAIR